MLEATRQHFPRAKVYQASTSELFGKALEVPQTERTPFYPCSPYGVAKLFGYWTTVNYREAYGMFATNGILFNHESPRRQAWAVTKKVSYGVAQIAYGLVDKIILGNLSPKRDWGYAEEYVESMWRMLQHDIPDDFVIATGESHSVKEFIEEAFEVAGIDNWKKHIKIDPKNYRLEEVWHLQGDASKAKKVLGWTPKVKFKSLVKLMVDADMKKVVYLIQQKEARMPLPLVLERSHHRPVTDKPEDWPCYTIPPTGRLRYSQAQPMALEDGQQER